MTDNSEPAPERSDCPFSDAEREWLEANLRDLVAEALVELSIADDEDETDGPAPCPQCGADRVREMGREEPVCLDCDR